MCLQCVVTVCVYSVLLLLLCVGTAWYFTACAMELAVLPRMQKSVAGRTEDRPNSVDLLIFMYVCNMKLLRAMQDSPGHAGCSVSANHSLCSLKLT